MINLFRDNNLTQKHCGSIKLQPEHVIGLSDDAKGMDLVVRICRTHVNGIGDIDDATSYELSIGKKQTEFQKILAVVKGLAYCLTHTQDKSVCGFKHSVTMNENGKYVIGEEPAVATYYAHKVVPYSV